MMKQTQSSSGRVMAAYLLPVKLKLLWLGIHPSVSLLSVTPWLICWKDRKDMQFIKSAGGKRLVKMCCPVFWLIVFVASLIHSYSSICLSALSCPVMVKTWDVLCLWLRGDLGFLVSLLVQLCGPCHAGHYHLHLLPAEVLRVLYQPACARSSTVAVWVRHLWMGQMESTVREKVEDTQWTCVFVPHQVVHHTSHVPSLLRVQDPQHSLRGPHQREPLHRHQWQCGHVRAGALHQQCEFCGKRCWDDHIWSQGIVFIMTVFCLPVALTPWTSLNFCSLSFLGLHSISCFSFSLCVSDQIFLFLSTVLLYSFLSKCCFLQYSVLCHLVFHCRNCLWVMLFILEAFTPTSQCLTLFSLRSVP